MAFHETLQKSPGYDTENVIPLGDTEFILHAGKVWHVYTEDSESMLAMSDDELRNKFLQGLQLLGGRYRTKLAEAAVDERVANYAIFVVPKDSDGHSLRLFQHVTLALGHAQHEEYRGSYDQVVAHVSGSSTDSVTFAINLQSIPVEMAVSQL